ncbi:hypothetical protein AMTR_s00026p00202960 [Amborella trichopoda]|uniref:Uncharacterized protein n=1 Tax=Amborella trichopoda TaxID=13333 RepID=W1PRT9_AMBTC|nr:hypothetical protein AMTR_s00026p00202960 [Amborella trichopoda]
MVFSYHNAIAFGRPHAGVPPSGHSPCNSHWSFPHRHIPCRNPSSDLLMPLINILSPVELPVNPRPLSPLLLIVATLCHYQSPHRETFPIPPCKFTLEYRTPHRNGPLRKPGRKTRY